MSKSSFDCILGSRSLTDGFYIQSQPDKSVQGPPGPAGPEGPRGPAGEDGRDGRDVSDLK